MGKHKKQAKKLDQIFKYFTEFLVLDLGSYILRINIINPICLCILLRVKLTFFDCLSLILMRLYCLISSSNLSRFIFIRLFSRIFSNSSFLLSISSTINQSINQSINQLVKCQIFDYQFINQVVNQSINNQSIDKLIIN